MKTTAELWYSSEDGLRYVQSKQNDLVFGELGRGDQKIYVDTSVSYQEITGFGTSMDEASVYNFCQMPETSRDEILKRLFHPVNGNGWNMLRICFGSSDFTARDYYSYDEVPAGETDVDLKRFSIQKDVDYRIVEYIKRVMAVNPDVLIFASPWSPPAWMKDSKSMCGGRLLPEFYEVAARYYRMAIQAYEALGIPIYAFTLQNEPLMDNGSYPTCRFSWSEMRDFLKEVRKEFRAHGLKTRLWPIDHNFNMAMSYGARIAEDREAQTAIDGFAFHDYLDEPTEMSKLHARYPAIPIYLTERSVWGTRGVDRIIQYLCNWAQCYVAWVTCLDVSRQPNRGCHGADAPFVNYDPSKPGSFFFIPEVHLIGQLSSLIRRGARRIECNYGSKSFVTAAAFKNPDHSIVAVVVNQNDGGRHVEIQCGDKQITPMIPGKTLAAMRWMDF